MSVSWIYQVERLLQVLLYLVMFGIRLSYLHQGSFLTRAEGDLINLDEVITCAVPLVLYFIFDNILLL